MDKLRKALLLDIRTILHLLHSIAEGGGDWDEDIPRQEMTRLLSLAKSRLDVLNRVEQNLH